MFPSLHCFIVSLFHCFIVLIFHNSAYPASSIQQPATSNQQPETSSQQPSTSIQQPATSLNILSWNIYMRPRKVFRDGQVKRAHAIVEHLKDNASDIIVFQEAFDKKAKRILCNGLEKNFPYRFGPGKGGFIKVSSGVWIFSKLPLSNGRIIKFNSCKVQDCLAKKGAVFVETYKNGQKFHVIGTHLQAETGEKFQQIRKKQYEDIREKLIIPLTEKNVPMFVVGDMNTSKSDTTAYNDMLNTFNVEDGALEGENSGSYNIMKNDLKEGKSADTEPDENVKIIDYILFQPNGIQPLSFTREVIIFQYPWNEKHKDLSDHYAVYAEIIF